jgi:hypothetical protein
MTRVPGYSADAPPLQEAYQLERRVTSRRPPSTWPSPLLSRPPGQWAENWPILSPFIQQLLAAIQPLQVGLQVERAAIEQQQRGGVGRGVDVAAQVVDLLQDLQVGLPLTPKDAGRRTPDASLASGSFLLDRPSPGRPMVRLRERLVPSGKELPALRPSPLPLDPPSREFVQTGKRGKSIPWEAGLCPGCQTLPASPAICQPPVELE